MTINSIIKHIATQHMVEDIVHNIAGFDEDLKDLIQDIYVELYTKDEKLLNDLYYKKQLQFYITRIVMNNVFSTTSRYYTTYKKTRKINEDIDKINTNLI